jgi:hypothetical protein
VPEDQDRETRGKGADEPARGVPYELHREHSPAEATICRKNRVDAGPFSRIASFPPIITQLRRLCDYDLAASNRRATSFQATTFHQFSMYSGRLF